MTQVLEAKWILANRHPFLMEGKADASMYLRGSIPKFKKVKGKKVVCGRRIIHKPILELAKLQRDLIDALTPYRVGIHDAAIAYRKNKCTVDAATAHLARRVNVRMDMEDFFPSITPVMVKQGLPKTVPKYLVKLILRWCFLDGGLPQGAPSSPHLSNVAGFSLDVRISALTKYWRARRGNNRLFNRTGIKLNPKFVRLEPIFYTRYCDDIYLSSNYKHLGAIVGPLNLLISSTGLKVNKKKTKVSYRNRQRQSVLGIVVNSKTPSNLRMSRRVLKATMHNNIMHVVSGACKPRHKLVNDTEVPLSDDLDFPFCQLDGQVSYMTLVNKQQGAVLNNLLTILKEIHTLPEQEWSYTTLEYSLRCDPAKSS